MAKSRRVFTREFKLSAVKGMESGKSVGLIARRLEVDGNTLYRWRREFKEQPSKAFSGHGRQILGESREADKLLILSVLVEHMPAHQSVRSLSSPWHEMLAQAEAGISRVC